MWVLPLHVGPAPYPYMQAPLLAPQARPLGSPQVLSTYHLLTWFEVRAYFPTPRFGLLALLLGGIAYSFLFPAAPPPA